MTLGPGSNAELTRKYERVKVQNDIRTSKHINKQTSPIFNCVTPESVSLASLANYNNNKQKDYGHRMHSLNYFLPLCLATASVFTTLSHSLQKTRERLSVTGTSP